MSPEKAALGNLQFAGWVLDVAFRLRGSTTSPIGRVQAIGLDVGLSTRDLAGVMATLELMQWITVTRDQDGKAVSVTEAMPSPAELVGLPGCWTSSALSRSSGPPWSCCGRPPFSRC